MHRYSEETRRRVLEAAEKLGYRPNRAAQMIRRGKSRLIGVVHFGTSTHQARQMAHYLPQAIQRNDYQPFVVDLSWQGDSYQTALERLIEMRVEGVIIAGLVNSFTEKDLQLLQHCGIPTVLLATSTTLNVPAVFSGTRLAFAQMVTHFFEEGHRNLTLLVNDYQYPSTLNRIAGFRDGLERHCADGLKGEIVTLPADKDPFVAGLPAYHYMKERLAGKAPLPDGILCSNDRWAQGVFTAALEAGLQIPGDLALSGCDNDPFGALAPYHLTTTTANIGDESEKAVEVLMELIAGRPLPQQHHVFEHQLIVRESSRRARSPALAERPPGRAGFSLLELLITLAAVAILVGLLFPAALRTVEAGNQAKCLSHLRQWGVAIAHYAADHNALLPPAQMPIDPANPSSRMVGWDERIAPFVPLDYQQTMKSPDLGPRRRSILVCPAEREVLARGDYTYAQNIDLNYRLLGEKALVRLTGLTNPGSYVILSDSYRSLTLSTATRAKLETSIMPQRRHRGIPNFLYADGHAAPFTEPLVGYNEVTAANRSFYHNLWYARGLPPHLR